MFKSWSKECLFPANLLRNFLDCFDPNETYRAEVVSARTPLRQSPPLTPPFPAPPLMFAAWPPLNSFSGRDRLPTFTRPFFFSLIDVSSLRCFGFRLHAIQMMEVLLALAHDASRVTATCSGIPCSALNLCRLTNCQLFFLTRQVANFYSAFALLFSHGIFLFS